MTPLRYPCLPALAWAGLFAAAAPLAARDEAPAPESAPDPEPLYRAAFGELEPGRVPGDYFVIEGDWSIAESGEGLALTLDPGSIVDAQVQLGDTLRDTGGLVRAKVKAGRTRRSFPRFGIGLHGMSGYRLRLFPAGNRLELVRSEEALASAELDWDAEKWWFLELEVAPSGEGWAVSGRAWPEDGERPEQPQVALEGPAARLSGKASVSGTPFAGLPIQFAEFEVHQIEREGGGEPPEGD